MPRGEAAAAPLFAICYDLSDDRERRRVDRVLAGYGFRAQKSVYECHLTAADRKRLQRKLENLALATGHVKLYRVYASAGAATVGSAPRGLDESFVYSV